jgi:hypothetical protein
VQTPRRPSYSVSEEAFVSDPTVNLGMSHANKSGLGISGPSE